jgi:hypothetical protein
MQVALAPPVLPRDRDAEARAANDALPLRSLVLALAGFVALSAIAGGMALLWAPRGNEVAPIALLSATPFETFVVPGLLLALGVGGTSAACFGLVLRRSAFAIDAAMLAGGALSLWIVCEVAILRQFSPLQLVYGALGLALLAIGIAGAARSPEARHRWTLGVTLGEALGFLAPALVGGIGTAFGVHESIVAALLVLAGAVEGLACGVGQAFAFPLPVSRPRFAALTSIAAAMVWALAMLVVGLAHSASSLAIPALVIVAPVGLVLMGAAQWLELRRHAFRAHRWIAWSTLAWLVALPASFAPMPFVDETTPLAANIALFASAGVTMAYVMALVTWQGVRRLVG